MDDSQISPLFRMVGRSEGGGGPGTTCATPSERRNPSSSIPAACHSWLVAAEDAKEKKREKASLSFSFQSRRPFKR